MPRHKDKPDSGRPGRLSPPLPPLTRSPSDPILETMVVLDEIHDREAAVILWQMLQDVMLWASLPPPQRGDLFNDEAGDTGGKIEGLDVSLSTLNHMVHDPEVASEEVVCRLCIRIADWAEERRALGTALAFVEAAAKVDPKSAAYAYQAGKLARRKAEYPRAEVWLRRAITLARRSKDWKSFALAFAGLGNLYRQRGDYALAIHFHMRSLRVARRHSLHELHGDALHNLAAITLELGNYPAGYTYSRGALEVYGPGHPRLVTLAHDLAWFWMTRQGAYLRALRVFKELPRHIWDPAPRLCLMTNIARAAGGAGLHNAFEQAWKEAWSMMQRAPDGEGHASALLHLAYGAASLAEWDHARSAAQLARSVAEERQEKRVRADAETLLRVMGDASGAEEGIRSILPQPAEESDAEADILAAELITALKVPSRI